MSNSTNDSLERLPASAGSVNDEAVQLAISCLKEIAAQQGLTYAGLACLTIQAAAMLVVAEAARFDDVEVLNKRLQLATEGFAIKLLQYRDHAVSQNTELRHGGSAPLPPVTGSHS